MDCSVLVLSLGATQFLLITGSNRTEEVLLLHRQTLDPPFSYIKCTGEETSEHVVTKGQRDRLAAYSTVDVLKSPDHTNYCHAASQPKGLTAHHFAHSLLTLWKHGSRRLR